MKKNYPIAVAVLSQIAKNAENIFHTFETVYGKKDGGYLAVFSSDSNLLQTTRISEGHDFEKESAERKCLILSATPAAISSSQTIAQSKGAIRLNNALIIGFACKDMSQDEKELFILALARSMTFSLGESSMFYDGELISIDDVLSITRNGLLTKELINQLIKGE